LHYLVVGGIAGAKKISAAIAEANGYVGRLIVTNETLIWVPRNRCETIAP
jgi:hypothetical protein